MRRRRRSRKPLAGTASDGSPQVKLIHGQQNLTIYDADDEIAIIHSIQNKYIHTILFLTMYRPLISLPHVESENTRYLKHIGRSSSPRSE